MAPPVPNDWSTHQLAEFVAQVSSFDEETAALVGGVERAAEALEAEIGLVVLGDRVAASVGLGENQPPDARLIGFRDSSGMGAFEDLLTLGKVYALAAPLSGEESGRIIFARAGDRPFDPEERNLVRGMARVMMMVVEMIRSTNALRQSQEETEEILESASDAFVSIDRLGTVTGWNRQAEAMFGWSREEIVGLQLAETIIPPSYREAHLKGMARLQETGEEHVLGQRLELSAVRRNGTEFPVELTIWAAGSAPLSFNAFVRDITLSKRAEEVRGLLAALVESTNDTVIAYSVDGAIRTWNSGAQALYGFTSAEMIGRSFLEIVPDELADEARRNLKIVLGGQRVTDFETRRKTKYGAIVDVSITISPILDAAGRVIGISSIGRDITNRKQAEQILKRAFEHEREMVQKLQQVDQIKSNFVSSVSHELRTPLTSIVGYLELLLEEGDGAFTGSQQEMIGIIDRNSRRLLELIEDVLTLSRVESGKFEISPVRLDLRALVDEMSQAVAPMIGGRSLEFAVDLGDVKQVVADASQLERVLLNLLTNAIKFTPDGGRITVSARAEGAMVAVSVADTGIGIAHEDQAKLFDYFYRASAAQAMAIPGTGLGLAIVKNIVEKHGGTVRVESQPGAGTTFTFTVPSGRPVEMPAPEEENVDRASKGGD